MYIPRPDYWYKEHMATGMTACGFVAAFGDTGVKAPGVKAPFLSTGLTHDLMVERQETLAKLTDDSYDPTPTVRPGMKIGDPPCAEND